MPTGRPPTPPLPVQLPSMPSGRYTPPGTPKGSFTPPRGPVMLPTLPSGQWTPPVAPSSVNFGSLSPGGVVRAASVSTPRVAKPEIIKVAAPMPAPVFVAEPARPVVVATPPTSVTALDDTVRIDPVLLTQEVVGPAVFPAAAVPVSVPGSPMMSTRVSIASLPAVTTPPKEILVEAPRLQEIRVIQSPVASVQSVREVPITTGVEIIQEVNEVPQVRVQEVVQEVPQLITHDRVVEVPQVQVAEVVRQVPIPQYREVHKEVRTPAFQPVARLAEVPEIE